MKLEPFYREKKSFGLLCYKLILFQGGPYSSHNHHLPENL